ncbi:MAG: beta-galactosidase, partial [Abditibacteriales bacterium]|nr:beta-galactosidase [Abditibacteriales bacterium]MDW8367609.1 hypothetical protein [Abditibacteriales bacterium]
QSPDVIENMVAVFRRAGINLVRFHHIDERGGIIDLTRDDSRHLDPEKLDLLDYWIFKCKQAGIYVYLDLLDYRTFKPGDGVPNAAALGRGAKPYAVFNRRLIDLQKEYAENLLRRHVNPYTGLSYADDPAIVMIELFDENGLFMKRNMWRSLAEPYATEFKQLWNRWLKLRYGSTETLAKTWTNHKGECALMPGESLEKGTVELPLMDLNKPSSGYARSVSSPARRNDGAQFAYDLHRAYYREMKTYLRGLGVRVPLTAIVRQDDLPDLKAVAEELDFVGNNFYWDHPSWRPKEDWQLPSFFRGDNPISEDGVRGVAPSLSITKVRGKPLVCREWNYCYPNPYRSAGILETTAYAALQDVDCIILFTYDAIAPRIGYFDVHSDPARWGLVGMAAKMFLQRDVAPSRLSVAVAHSQVGTFSYARYLRPFYSLAWVSRMNNDFFDDTYTPRIPPRDNWGQGEVNFVLSGGRDTLSQYRGAPTLLYTQSKSLDLYDKQRRETGRYLDDYPVNVLSSGRSQWRFDGVLFGDGEERTFATSSPVFSLADVVAQKMVPIGQAEAQGAAYGFYDPKTGNYVFNYLSDAGVLRVALDALGRLAGGTPNQRNPHISHRCVESRLFVSDTGELVRQSAGGRLFIHTPTTQAVVGNLGSGEIALSALRLKANGTGALIATSLDGKPLAQSQRYLVKMVTDARNTGEDVTLTQLNGLLRYQLTTFGQSPIITGGAAASIPVQVSIGGRKVLEVYLSRGTFELVVDRHTAYFYCDTPGVEFAFDRDPQRLNVVSYQLDGTQQTLIAHSPFTYPAGAAFVRVTQR